MRLILQADEMSNGSANHVKPNKEEKALSEVREHVIILWGGAEQIQGHTVLPAGILGVLN